MKDTFLLTPSRAKELVQHATRSKRIRAGIHLIGGNGVGAIAAFLAAIVAARSLTIDEFAAFGVGLAVASIAVQFSDLSLGTVAVAEIAESPGQAAARQRLAAITRHRLAGGVVVPLLVVAAVLLLPSLEPYQETAVIGALGGIPGSLSLFGVNVLQGFGAFRSAGGLQTISGLLRLALVGFCAVAGFGAPEMMMAYAIVAPVISLVLLVPLVAYQLTGEKWSGEIGPDGQGPKSNSINHNRRRIFAATGVVSALIINGDMFLLTTFGSAEEVGEYAAAWRFSAGVLLVNTAIAGALLPYIMAAQSPWKETRRLVRSGMLVAGAWFVVTPVLYLLGPVVLGPTGEAARGPLLILLIAFSLDAYYFVLYQVFIRIRRALFLLVVGAIELAVMVSVTLLSRSEGAIAPALGQLGARVVVVAGVTLPIILFAAGKLDWFRDRPPARLS